MNMEQQIKQAVRNLNIGYILFWTIPAFLLGAGESGVFPTGHWAEHPRAVYYFETLGILTVILCVPLSLKSFSLVLKKRINTATAPLALKRYVRWSAIRLAILEIAVIANILCYYSTLNSTGHLCMLIGLTASLFCLPSEKRLRNELHIYDKVEGDEGELSE